MQAVGVEAHVEVVEDVLDDLTKGKRHDGEVVTAQAHDRDADDEAGDGRDERRDDEGEHIGEKPVAHDAAHDGERNDAREGAHAHEAGVSQRQLAGDAHDEVERDGHAHIGADGHELAGERVGEDARGVERGHDDEERDDDTVRDEVGLQALAHATGSGCGGSGLCHGATPSP